MRHSGRSLSRRATKPGTTCLKVVHAAYNVSPARGASLREHLNHRSVHQIPACKIGGPAMADAKKKPKPQPFPEEIKNADDQRSAKENQRIDEAASKASVTKAKLVDRVHALSR
jgi:hypothetical protein